jgi:cytochrome c oxidase cbb3-type subunit 3
VKKRVKFLRQNKKWLPLLAAALLASASAHAQFPRTPVDPAAATGGQAIYTKDCAKCHGADGRGGSASDLVRSTVVLHDRRENLLGKELAPFLKSTPPHKFSYNDKQAQELSQYLTSNINHILRSGYDDHPTHLTDGDAKVGEAYFAENCSKCHSATGDMAGIGGRTSTAALQQKWLFPNTGIGKKQPIAVTVTMPNGKTLTGDQVRIDDFTVTLRDKDGVTHSANRTAGVRVKTVDPYEGHYKLLDKYTDADIHNVTTYLDTLK